MKEFSTQGKLTDYQKMEGVTSPDKYDGPIEGEGIHCMCLAPK
jgi:hypothetical protein